MRCQCTHACICSVPQASQVPSRQEVCDAVRQSLDHVLDLCSTIVGCGWEIVAAQAGGVTYVSALHRERHLMVTTSINEASNGTVSHDELDRVAGELLDGIQRMHEGA